MTRQIIFSPPPNEKFWLRHCARTFLYNILASYCTIILCCLMSAVVRPAFYSRYLLFIVRRRRRPYGFIIIIISEFPCRTLRLSVRFLPFSLRQHTPHHPTPNPSIHALGELSSRDLQLPDQLPPPSRAADDVVNYARLVSATPPLRVRLRSSRRHFVVGPPLLPLRSGARAPCEPHQIPRTRDVYRRYRG